MYMFMYTYIYIYTYEGKTSEPTFHRPRGHKILHLKLLVGPRVWLVCSPPPAALANPRLVVVRHT